MIVGRKDTDYNGPARKSKQHTCHPCQISIKHISSPFYFRIQVQSSRGSFLRLHVSSSATISGESILHEINILDVNSGQTHRTTALPLRKYQQDCAPARHAVSPDTYLSHITAESSPNIHSVHKSPYKPQHSSALPYVACEARGLDHSSRAPKAEEQRPILHSLSDPPRAGGRSGRLRVCQK